MEKYLYRILIILGDCILFKTYLLGYPKETGVFFSVFYFYGI